MLRRVDAWRLFDVLKTLKITSSILVITLILFLAQCVYVEISQREKLFSLCENSGVGKKISSILKEATSTAFQIRSETMHSDTEGDWFNREYNRILEQANKDKNSSKAYVVIFAKPGIGYYACIIEHAAGLVTKSRFEDRSS